MSTEELQKVATKLRALNEHFELIVKEYKNNDKLIDEINKLVLKSQIHFDNGEALLSQTTLSQVAIKLQQLTKSYGMIGLLRQMARGRPNLQLELYNSDQSFEDMFKGPNES